MLAMDRWQAKPVIQKWLDDGDIVLSDRYVYSLAHQAARLPEEKREDFINWFLEMEFEMNGLPKEDLVIFLYVPTDFTIEMVKKKERREHLNGKDVDIAESDFDHQRKSEEVYLQFADRFDNWEVIDCVNDGKLRSIEDINNEMMEVLKENMIIPS
jgi:dTMP kinase